PCDLIQWGDHDGPLVRESDLTRSRDLRTASRRAWSSCTLGYRPTGRPASDDTWPSLLPVPCRNLEDHSCASLIALSPKNSPRLVGERVLVDLAVLHD